MEFSEEDMKNIDRGWAWVICGASCTIQALSMGISLCLGLFIDIWLEEFNDSLSNTSWVVTIALCLPFFIGPFSSMFSNKFGYRVTVIFGGIITSIGYIIASFSHNLADLYIAAAVIGVGIGFAYVPSFAIVNESFHKRRALALGLVTSGTSVAVLVLPPIIEQLNEIYGWRGALFILGAVTMNLCVAGALYRDTGEEDRSEDDQRYLYERDEDEETAMFDSQDISVHKRNTLPRTLQKLASTLSIHRSHDRMYKKVSDIESNGVLSADGHHQKTHLSRLQALSGFLVTSLESLRSTPMMDDYPEIIHWGEALSEDGSDTTSRRQQGHFDDKKTSVFDVTLLYNPVMITYGLSIFLARFGYIIPITHMAASVSEQGFDRSTSALVLSAIGGASMLGRIFNGWFADLRIVKPYVLFGIGATLTGAVNILRPFAVNRTMLFVYALVFGFSSSLFVTLISVLLVEFLGVNVISNSFGLTMAFQAMAFLAAPQMAAWLYDSTYSYSAPFFIGGGTILIAAVLVFTIGYLTMNRFNSTTTSISSQMPSEIEEEEYSEYSEEEQNDESDIDERQSDIDDDQHHHDDNQEDHHHSDPENLYNTTAVIETCV